MISIPVDSDDAVGKEVIFCASAGHSVFEEEGIAHGFVGARAQLLEEGLFHVTREFLEKVGQQDTFGVGMGGFTFLITVSKSRVNFCR